MLGLGLVLGLGIRIRIRVKGLGLGDARVVHNLLRYLKKINKVLVWHTFIFIKKKK
jgi:hypothetical protein